MVTFVVEDWLEVKDEMSALWPAHWKEVALDHDAIPLDPDLELYDHLAESGMLHVLVARDEGRIIGYHLSIVKPHLHYRTSLHAQTDVYYIDPAYRKGMTGVRLFKEAERTLVARGVKKMITGTKMSLDMGKIFERLGWRETERTYTKCIGA
jgi:L-amino acid N-acyltransferase YncA